MAYTLGEAAKAVGKSKGTISKAIKTGRISATKLDNGSYSIEAVELHRVYPATPSYTGEGEPMETPSERLANDRETIELTARLAKAEAELSAEREKVDLLQRHLDDVRRMLPPPDAKPRRRWWPW